MPRGLGGGQAIPLREKVGCRRVCGRQRAIAGAKLEGDVTPVAFRSGSTGYAPGGHGLLALLAC